MMTIFSRLICDTVELLNVVMTSLKCLVVRGGEKVRLILLNDEYFQSTTPP